MLLFKCILRSILSAEDGCPDLDFFRIGLKYRIASWSGPSLEIHMMRIHMIHRDPHDPQCEIYLSVDIRLDHCTTFSDECPSLRNNHIIPTDW